MLKFNKIYKQYETPILGPINLEIEKDSFVSILGSSGAGKSTLLRLASNLIQPTSGSIEYLGLKMIMIYYKSLLLLIGKLKQSKVVFIKPWHQENILKKV